MQELKLVTENRQDYITEPSGQSHVTESSNGKWQHPLRQIHGRGSVPAARNLNPKPHKRQKGQFFLCPHIPLLISHYQYPQIPQSNFYFSWGLAPEFPISVRPADILCRGPDLFSGYPLVKPACQGQLRRLSDLHPAEDGIYPTSKAA